MNKSTRRLPAEWEPQDAVLLAWPHADTDWAPTLDDALDCYINIVRAAIPHVPLVIVSPEATRLDDIFRPLDPSGRRVICRNIPTNDTWARDFGPITVEDAGGMLPLDFTFNGWGLKFAADRDNLITQRLDAGGLFARRPESRRAMVLEGGAVESDGRGTILTTSQCLLSPNRNPWMSRTDIERAFADAFGATRVLWLDHGHLAGDDTDSHIDTLARFAPDDTILYVAPPEYPDDEHYSDLCAMEQQLRTFTTAEGNPYNLIALPMADPVYSPDGERLPATYANFLVTNGAVLVPSYGSPRKDRLAADMLRIAYPGHTVHQVDCRALIVQHGSLHCVTMQLPAATLS
ncbi:MAG: agmatine deiminase family protein [Candidatus Amulumruptor caecigallinarius]|nr:agmatine deiminase family protein [Candidatus Amulumruptor caecigallinarius]MCM1396936.1 agmatine deiminase family protein [Candidatus Amulumruptor caecigallinarius]